MNALLARWSRMGLFQKLLLVSAGVIFVAASAMAVLSVCFAEQQAKQQMDERLRENLSSLTHAMEVSYPSGQQAIEEVLRAQLLLVGTKAIVFNGTTLSMTAENNVQPAQTAPSWIVRLLAIPDRQETQPVRINDHAVGQIFLTLSAVPFVNAAWEYLLHQLLILTLGALIVFAGAWLMLRSNLKPFAALVAGSQALGRGDFSSRMAVSGNSEFRSLIRAFNTMADDLERLIAELRQRERVYTTLVETAPVGIYQADLSGNVTFTNKAMQKLLDLQSIDITAETWYQRVHPDDHDRMMEYRMRILRDGAAGNSVYRLRGAEGRMMWVQSPIAPVLDEQGKPGGYIGTVTDITTERDLWAKTERLSVLYATLSQVNSAIIHCRTEQELYNAICSILVEKGGFARATVFRPDWSRRKAICIAQTANRESALRHELVELDLDDPESGSLIAATFLSNGTVTANDIQNDERFGTNIRGPIAEIELQSASSVMFTCFGETISALSLASKQKNYFTEEILALIAEVGRDVSFALENFSREEKRRRAEELLARNEENLRITLRSIGDAVLVTDTESRVTLMNPVAEMLTGWSEAEARGRLASEVFRIVNEETRAIVDSPVERVLREGVIVGLANHTILIARDGSERPIADSGAPIRYATDGNVMGVILVFRDQTDDYRMQKALRESERLYSSLVKTVPVGVAHADTEGRASFVNAAICKITGATSSNVTMQEWMSQLHPADRDGIISLWRNAVLMKTEFHAACRYLHPDGSVVWARVSVAPVLDDHGNIQGYVGAAVDITKEQEHLREIQQLSKLYATLSQVSAAIARSGTEEALYKEIVRIFVDTGGFDMATLVDPYPDKNGETRGFIRHLKVRDDLRETLKASLPDQENIPPLVSIALASVKTQISNDYLNDERLDQEWRKRSRGLNVAAAMAIPFLCFGKAKTVLSLTSCESGFFTDDIVAMLEEIARDVSHAVEGFAKERQRKQVEEALLHNEERLRLSLQVTNIGFFDVNPRTERIRFDAICARLIGLDEATGELDIAEFAQHIGISSAEYSKIAKQGFRDGVDQIVKATSRDFALTLPDGRIRWLRSQGGKSGGHDKTGRPLRILGVISDITRQRGLEERNNLAATVFDNSGESILISAPDKTVQMVNQAFSRMTGYEAEEILGTSGVLLRSDRHDESFYEDIGRIAEKDGAWQGEIWRRRKNNEVFPAMVTVSAVRDKDGKLTNYVLQEMDISTQKAFEERISHLAYRDSLTSLPNRSLLRDRVEQSLATAHREEHSVALLFLDLDHFKNINDSLGHSIGDRLLKEIAQRLTHAVREMDTVGRLGGDEFLVLLPDADADAAAHVAQKLLDECARPAIVETHSLTVTPSVGIALYPRDGNNYDELLKTADTAMYRAKGEGRNAYRFYTPEMNQAVFQRMVLENGLRRAIENKEFALHYQPKFKLGQDRLIGVEALIRWYQPDVGMRSPAEFIPVAEESGLIEAIGKWVLEEACHQAKAWLDEGLPALRVGVNFSARQFATRTIAELVSETLATTGLPGEGLEIEITESLLAQDMDYTLEVLQLLKKKGIHVAVDDFGTGYSSLSYLKRFPIDRLKIDQSFVRDLVTDADDRAIASAIVMLGHSLNISVIAEGVETVEQMEILHQMGCDEVQGYYFGRPIAADEMTVALRKLAVTPSRRV